MMKQCFHSVQGKQGIHRYFSTAVKTSEIAVSKRQEFKSLSVHPSILNGIKALAIGIPPRKLRGRSLLPSSTKDSLEHRPSPPLPFGTKPRLVRQVGTEDILLTRDSDTAQKLKLPEVAIAGRSNVGKSTLLNALLFDANRLRKGKKAAVSSRPGETNRIAIYELEQRLRVVDLPGYGFAYGKKLFQELVIAYLSNRGNVLKRVLLLIDSRHGMKTSDLEFLKLLQEAPKVPPLQIVLTKCDEVEQMDLGRRVAQVKQQLSDAMRREPKTFPVMLVSVNPPRQVAGIFELQKSIAMMAKKRKVLGTEAKPEPADMQEDFDRHSPGPPSSRRNKRSDQVSNIWKRRPRSIIKSPASKREPVRVNDQPLRTITRRRKGRESKAMKGNQSTKNQEHFDRHSAGNTRGRSSKASNRNSRSNSIARSSTTSNQTANTRNRNPLSTKTQAARTTGGVNDPPPRVGKPITRRRIVRKSKTRGRRPSKSTAL